MLILHQAKQNKQPPDTGHTPKVKSPDSYSGNLERIAGNQKQRKRKDGKKAGKGESYGIFRNGKK